MELIRGISGIRGIVGKTLTTESAGSYALSFQKISGDGPILIARDSRQHGAEISASVLTAILSTGTQADDAGIIPTPTAQFLVERGDYIGGIVITASHNPLEWNGLKFIGSDGCFLDADRNQMVFDLVDGGLRMELGPVHAAGTCLDAIQRHIEHTCNLSVINTEAIRKRNFRVVVDAVNGAGSLALPGVLDALNCHVIPIHCTPDGQFPRGAEPLPENLTLLSAAVREYRADVGFATDPDGDRLALVDETGRPLGEEYTLTLCTDGFLAGGAEKKPVVTNLSTTMALDRVAEKYGVEVRRSAVGEINVVNKMKELGSLIGGEGNGGVILPESHYGRDALVAAAMTLHRMSLTADPLSAIFDGLPQFFMSKDKIQLGSLKPDEVLEQISLNTNADSQDTTDGLKLIWSDRWVHIRKSNTEPIIRIYAEAPSLEETRLLVNKIKSMI